MSEIPYQLIMSVRDYECDSQGIVNNAIYQNYLEHARHEFLKEKGLDFARLTASNINVMVIRAELDYKKSLRSGDAFVVSVRCQQESRLKIVFDQQIILQNTDQLILRARIFAAAVNQHGRPYFPEELKVLLL